MKLTEAQRRVLTNLVAGRHADAGFAGGRSTAGGLTGTFASLRRRGFITLKYPAQITDAGRAVLEQEKGK